MPGFNIAQEPAPSSRALPARQSGATAAKTQTRKTNVWRQVALLAFALLLLCLPLPRHWLLLERPLFAVYYEFTAFIVYLSDLAVLLLLLASALWFWRGRVAIRWGPALITLPLAILAVRALVTAFWADDSALALYFGGRLLILLLLYLTIVTLRPPKRLVQLSLATMLVGQAIVALTQFIGQHDLGWRILGELTLRPLPGAASIITAGNQSWLRGYGLTPHPNILGGFLASALIALVVAYLESNNRRRIVWLAVLLLGAGGLVITFSRAAWLGAAAGGATFVLALLTHRPWRRQYGRLLLVPIAAGLVVLATLVLLRGELFLARLAPPASYTESRSLDERQLLNEASLALIRRAPFRGAGAGAFSRAVTPLVVEIPGATPQPVHHVPLLVSAELGALAGLLWLALMVAPLLLAWRQLRAGRLSLWALGLTAGLVALAVIDFYDFYSWGWPQGRLLRWTYLALWAGAIGEPLLFSPKSDLIDEE